ncbi:MAG: vWA domain-containing protein [Christensenellales bacterium]
MKINISRKLKITALILAALLLMGIFPISGMVSAADQGAVQLESTQNAPPVTTPEDGAAQEEAVVSNNVLAVAEPVESPPEEETADTEDAEGELPPVASAQNQDENTAIIDAGNDAELAPQGVTVENAEIIENENTDENLEEETEEIEEIEPLLMGQELVDYLASLNTQERETALTELTEEQFLSTGPYLSDQQLLDWFNYSDELYEAITSVSATNAGPFMPPVTIRGSSRSNLLNRSAGDEDNGLELSKTAQRQSDGTYKISIEAYTTGALTVETKVVPTDIVLVLDESGSMAYGMDYTKIYESELSESGDYYIADSSGYRELTYRDLSGQSNDGWYYRSGWNWVRVYPARYDGDTQGGRTQFYYMMTRRSALQQAARNFIDAINSKANGEVPVDHRIAIVGFSSENNSAILSNFRDLTNSNSANQLKGVINNLRQNGGTRTNTGLSLAKSVFTNDSPPPGQRNRVVILFTDGEPGDTGFSNNIANSAIGHARDLKRTTSGGYGATVYTIGIFPGAAPNGSGNANNFMNYVSSNYPNAQSMSSPGTPIQPASARKYYLTAASSDALNDAFDDISQNVSSSGTTLEKATVKDVIAPSFQLAGNSGVSVYTAAFNGYTDSSDSEENWAPRTAYTGAVSIAGDTIQINDYTFDYIAGYVGETGDLGPRGAKLILEFYVEPNPDFIGGNGVPTNTEGSGIYTGPNASDDVVEAFPVPIVNVPLRFDYGVQDKHLYIGDALNIADHLFPNANSYAINTNAYDIDGINNGYVDIVYTVMDGAATVGTYTIPAGDSSGEWAWESGYAGGIKNGLVADTTAYTISALLRPTRDGEASKAASGGIIVPVAGESRGPKTANAKVYKPIITPQDTAVYLTNIPTLDDTTIEKSVVWKHAGATEADVSAMGPEPALDYTFNTEFSGYPVADTGVNIVGVTRQDNNYEIAIENRIILKADNTKATHFTVYVLKPIVDCEDGVMFLGEILPWSGHFGLFESSWAEPPVGVTAQGSEPLLSYQIDLSAPLNHAGADVNAFTPVKGGFFDFKIGVQADGHDVTQYATINNPIPVGPDEIDHHFTIEVKTGTLTITKSGGREGESYLFTITNVTTGATFFEVIQGNNTKVITGLPAGEYSISEQTDWSWRYSDAPQIGFKNGQNKLGKVGAEIDYRASMEATVNNHTRSDFWLSGESYAINKWSGRPR